MRLQGVWNSEATSERRAGRLRPDKRVFLCPEPDNEYDPNAIRVELSGSQANLGHLPRPLARCVRVNLDRGYEYDAEVSDVSLNSDGDLIIDINCSFNGQARADIADDPGSVPGVYVIANWATLKMYVGKSENVGHRLHLHKKLLKEHRHDKIELQKDWIKYGEEFFSFELLSQKKAGKSLEALEAKWLRLYGTCEPRNGYNFGEGWTPDTESRKTPRETQEKRRPPAPHGKPETTEDFQRPGAPDYPRALPPRSGIPRWVWVVGLAILVLWLMAH